MVDLRTAEVPCFINRWYNSLTTLKGSAEIIFLGVLCYLQG